MDINSQIKEHLSVIESLFSTCGHEIEEVALLVAKVLQMGGKVFFCGNGGSAGDAQHIAAELTGRFVKERKGLPGIALTTDTSALTAIGNDYGFDKIFVRQLQALSSEGDLLIAISTSGNSHNVNKAVEYGNLNGIVTVGLAGKDGGRLKKLAEKCIVVPSYTTARIQEAHILIGHIICTFVDEMVN